MIGLNIFGNIYRYKDTTHTSINKDLSKAHGLYIYSPDEMYTKLYMYISPGKCMCSPDSVELQVCFISAHNVATPSLYTGNMFAITSCVI